MHPSAQIRAASFHQEMEMVPHQNKAMHRDLEALRRAYEQLQELAPVSVVGENPLPGIPARQDMIRRALKLNPQRPGHLPLFGKNHHNVKCLDATPSAPHMYLTLTFVQAGA